MCVTYIHSKQYYVIRCIKSFHIVSFFSTGLLQNVHNFIKKLLSLTHKLQFWSRILVKEIHQLRIDTLAERNSAFDLQYAYRSKNCFIHCPSYVCHLPPFHPFPIDQLNKFTCIDVQSFQLTCRSNNVVNQFVLVTNCLRGFSALVR